MGIAAAVEPLSPPAPVLAAGPEPSEVGLIWVVGVGWPLVNGASVPGVAE